MHLNYASLKWGCMRLEEHRSLLLISQDFSPQLRYGQSSQELIIRDACIVELSEYDDTRKDEANKVSGHLNLSNAIEKSRG